MSEIVIGEGIFTWNGGERRTQRYGYVALSDADYGQTTEFDVTLDMAACEKLVGERVTLKAVVLRTRESGHLGDSLLEIRPTTPTVGEEIELGTGVFELTHVDYEWAAGECGVGLRPGDGRKKYWLDPRVLYRLHDQTVRLVACPTTAPDHPAPPFAPRSGNTIISNGDGTFQAYTDTDADVEGGRILPNIEKLEGIDGAFVLTRPHAEGNKGERFRLEVE